jgi:hypothetical protein
MLPNFLIIGTAKAGTTWLAKCLREHPDVFMPVVKEVYFFDKHFGKGLEWYEAYFSEWSGQTAVGEATPGYIGHPDAPDRIRRTLGNEVKLIASLRHPVDRAYSAFWMRLSHGLFPADADFREIFYQDAGATLREAGCYSIQLSRYLQHFPRENLLILIYEESKRDQAAVPNCFELIGVDSQFVPDALNKKFNKALSVSGFQRQVLWVRRAVKLLPRGVDELLASVGRYIFERLPQQRRYEPLARDLRQELLRYYMSDIEQLEGLLKRDLSIWYDPPHT